MEGEEGVSWRGEVIENEIKNQRINFSIGLRRAGAFKGV